MLTLLAGQFKGFIDSSIFRLRFLSRFANPRYFPPPMRRSSARESLPYLHSYLMYQVLREQPTAASRLGRIRLAAQVLNGSDGNLECLSSLVCLAITVKVYPLFWESTANPEDLDRCDNADTEADVFVAAAYLGRKDYVAHLIAKGIPSCQDPYLDSFNSGVFGSALNAATIQGNLEIIKLLLLRTPSIVTQALFQATFCTTFSMTAVATIAKQILVITKPCSISFLTPY